MNRTGLFIALGLFLVVGILFGLYPELDLKLAAAFYDAATKRIYLSAGEGFLDTSVQKDADHYKRIWAQTTARQPARAIAIFSRRWARSGWSAS